MNALPRRCFVISPIGEPGSDTRKHADTVFQGIVAPALEMLRQEGIEVQAVRSDHLKEPGKVSHQMFREIFTADLCIAVLTFSNPNVFYELAVAQSAFRPVVALLRQGDILPFDVTDLRMVSYDLLDPERLLGRTDADELAQNLRTMLGRGWSPPDIFGTDAPAPWALVRDPSALQKLIETSRPKPLPPGKAAVYALPGAPERQIEVLTGDVRHVHDIDVVVSSENTDLQLARYYDPSMSATLRYLDAQRDAGGRVVRDALDEELKRWIGAQGLTPPVMPGTVVPLPTHGLGTRGVRYVFLAAAVRGDGVGAGYSSIPAGELENCVRDCYRLFAERAAADGLESILFPVLGAGTARMDPRAAVDQLLPVIIESMIRFPECKRTCVLAWVESHRAALLQGAAALGLTPATPAEDR